jgi:hypothetical protein
LTSASGSGLLSLGEVLLTSSMIRTERLTHTLSLDLEFGSLLLRPVLQIGCGAHRFSPCVDATE